VHVLQREACGVGRRTLREGTWRVRPRASCERRTIALLRAPNDFSRLNVDRTNAAMVSNRTIVRYGAIIVSTHGDGASLQSPYSWRNLPPCLRARSDAPLKRRRA
jgi:hypothetical protein